MTLMSLSRFRLAQVAPSRFQEPITNVGRHRQTGQFRRIFDLLIEIVRHPHAYTLWASAGVSLWCHELVLLLYREPVTFRLGGAEALFHVSQMPHDRRPVQNRLSSAFPSTLSMHPFVTHLNQARYRASQSQTDDRLADHPLRRTFRGRYCPCHRRFSFLGWLCRSHHIYSVYHVEDKSSGIQKKNDAFFTQYSAARKPIRRSL